MTLDPNQIGARKAVERLQFRCAVHAFWTGLRDRWRSGENASIPGTRRDVRKMGAEK